MKNVTDYIKENIELAVCHSTDDTPTHFGLPHPYSVPTVGKTFHAMFYWDTYFTNLGLIELGDITQAEHNIENFAALIERFGYIPNGNTPSLSNRSQPPFFSLMIKDIFEHTNDVNWLKKLYPALCREHDFWINERSTQIGLAHYGGRVPPEKQEKYAREYCRRLGIRYKRKDEQMLAANFLSQAESGWDFNARFEFSSIDFCPIDLNSLLWALEDNLCTFASILENGEGEYWRKKADLRAALMREFLKSSDGAFYDRNARTKKFSPYFSAASLYPLFVGMATKDEAAATVALLPKLMHTWGIAPCEVIKDGIPFQWGAPNGWPCLQFICFVGLKTYGYNSHANDIAKCYVDMVENVFAKTGALWEKYNLDSGSCDAVNEYEMPEMLGWTAGVYLYFKNHLDIGG